MFTSPNQTPPPAGLTSREPFVTAHTRATIVTALFVLYIVVALFALATNLMALVSEPIVLVSENGQDFTLYDLLMLLSLLGTFLIYFALGITFLLWLYRVSKNIPTLGNPKSRVAYEPGWAVGSFFVPFANLFIPYKAVREVWDKSDPAVRTEDDFMFAPPSSAPLVLGWWLAWLASSFLTNIAWQVHGDNLRPDTLHFVAGFHSVAHLVSILAAVLAIFVVRGIDQRQAERARHVTYAGNMPPPPPVFRPQQPHVSEPRPAGMGSAPPPFGQS